MTPLVFLALAAAGGLGAAARFMLDGAIRSRVPTRMPWGTIIINTTGSFALGFLVGLGSAQLLAPELQLIIGTGFLGGYTTFSTASFETIRLAQDRKAGMAVINGLGQVVVATAAAAAGLVLAGLISA